MIEERPNESPEELNARITKQVQGVYEILPEVTGMHFTQADKIDSIKANGLVAGDSQSSFAYSFDKNKTDESFGDQLERAKLAQLEHYSAMETLSRFQEAFKDGMDKYGIQKIRGAEGFSDQSVREFLMANKGKLPAVVFLDLTGIPAPSRQKSSNKLPQTFFTSAEASRIIKVITIDESDFPTIAEKIENGAPFELPFEEILLVKTKDWLLSQVQRVVN